MAGFDNDVIYGINIDLSNQGNGQTGSETLVTDGQMLIATTALNAGGTHVNVGTLTSPGGSVTIGYSSPNITLEAGGAVPTTFTADTGTATPAANNINLLGGSNGIDTIASGSTVTFNFDVTEQPTIPTSFVTPSGTATPALNVLNFANGTGVSITGAGATVTVNASGSTPLSFPTDSGTATPAANALTIAGSGSITTSGAAATVTVQLTGLTNHALLVGAGTTTITKVGPTATAGQVLQSAGAAADPAFSTATYPSTATGTGTILRADGTNWSPTTSTYPNTNAANTLLYASSANVMAALATANNGTLVTSNTGVPSILAGPGTTGNILQSNAAAAPSFSTATYPSTTTINQVLYSSANNVVGAITAANNGTMISSATGVPSWLANGTTGQILTATTGSPPSWAAAASSGFTTINVQIFTANGTYTPTANMKYCIVEAVAGGGGGGGAATTAAGQAAAGAGGGSGSYRYGYYTAADIGASKAVVIGAGGTAGANTGGNGGTGGSTGLTGLFSIDGGLGGTGSGAAAASCATQGGAGGNPTTAGAQAFGRTGQSGTNGAASNAGAFAIGGTGGASHWSGGGQGGAAIAGRAAGLNGNTNTGAGGGGAAVTASQTGFTGGVGAAGMLVATEFI